jgi:hypothetical protein
MRFDPLLEFSDDSECMLEMDCDICLAWARSRSDLELCGLNRHTSSVD